MSNTWTMFALPYQDGSFHNIGSEFYAKAYALPGEEVVAVHVVEDAEGEYYGWLDQLAAGIPALIQPDYRLFDMQFTYGVQSSVNSGKGQIIRLKISAA